MGHFVRFLTLRVKAKQKQILYGNDKKANKTSYLRSHQIWCNFV